MKTYRQKNKMPGGAAADAGAKKGPEEAKLKVCSLWIAAGQADSPDCYDERCLQRYSDAPTNSKQHLLLSCHFLQEILDRTGYTLDVTTGQRKYGGPPPDWEGTQPGAGHEVIMFGWVFWNVVCGVVSKHCIIHCLHSMSFFSFRSSAARSQKTSSKMNLFLCLKSVDQFGTYGWWWTPWRGWIGVFVLSHTQRKRVHRKLWNRSVFLLLRDQFAVNLNFPHSISSVISSVRQLDNYEIRKGKNLKCNISVANLRLFVGNIPKSKSKEEIQEEFSKITGTVHHAFGHAVRTWRQYKGLRQIAEWECMYMSLLLQRESPTSLFIAHPMTPKRKTGDLHSWNMNHTRQHP